MNYKMLRFATNAVRFPRQGSGDRGVHRSSLCILSTQIGESNRRSFELCVIVRNVCRMGTAWPVSASTRYIWHRRVCNFSRNPSIVYHLLSQTSREPRRPPMEHDREYLASLLPRFTVSQRRLQTGQIPVAVQIHFPPTFRDAITAIAEWS